MAPYEVCPKCGAIGEIDKDQAGPNASASIVCFRCGYHYKWENGEAVPK